MIAVQQNNRDAFFTWAASVFPAKRCKWIEENILRMEQLAVTCQIISGSIFDVTDMSTLEYIYKAAERNKIFQVKNRKLIKNTLDDFKAYMQYCSRQAEHTEEAEEVTDVVPSESVSKAAVSAEINSEIFAVITQHYEYGFKYDSPRELMRLRQFADAMGITLQKRTKY